MNPKPQSISWEKRFDQRYLRNKGWILDGKNGADIKSFIQSLLQQQSEEAFKEGRRSVLDEWDLIQNKLLQGFSYKKI